VEVICRELHRASSGGFRAKLSFRLLRLRLFLSGCLLWEGSLASTTPTWRSNRMKEFAPGFQYSWHEAGPEGKQYTVLAEGKADVFDSPSLLVIALGRVRQYGESYDPTSVGEWLPSLLRGGGKDWYGKIAGFFALVVYDRQSQALSLISDHIGSLPLYYSSEPYQLLITDSLDLLCSQKRVSLSHQALFQYCYHHTIPAPHTAYVGVAKTEAGAELSFPSVGEPISIQLYSPSYTPFEGPLSELRSLCRSEVEDAVERNVSGNVGAFLSGGLDSSTVTGFLAKAQSSARTFSVGFNAEGYDETEYARLAAKHFQTIHDEAYLQPEDLDANFARVAQFFSEPFGNSSALAVFFCALQAKRANVDVMLAGDGGDEIFAGNERYRKQMIFEPWRRLPMPFRSAGHILAGTVLQNIPLFRKVSSYINQAEIPLPDRLDGYNFLRRFDIHEVFTQDFLQDVDLSEPAQAKRERYFSCESTVAVDRMMFLDWKYTLADNDLVKVSRMCRLAGIEVRFPLLEKELVDFSCRIPAHIKLPGHRLRGFFKDCFSDFLPRETLTKSKHGFGLPFGTWMRENDSLRKAMLTSMAELKGGGIFQPQFIDRAIRKYQAGHAAYYGELLWIMMVLEHWLRSRKGSGFLTSL